MKPGAFAIVRKATLDGHEVLEGVAQLERLIHADYQDGRERWSVRFLKAGDVADRIIAPNDLVDPEDLEERLGELEREDQHGRRVDALAWHRKSYGVPARKGMRVTYRGEPGVITGASGPHLMIRMDSGARWPVHPSDDNLAYRGGES